MAYTKGQIITLDGKEYRIIKLNGSVAEVVGMTNASDSTIFGTSQDYAGSTLDTLLNETFYATLSDKLKTAIVDKTFTQDSWYLDASGNPDYEANYGTNATAYQLSLGSATFGSEITRHVYALSIQDIVDYLEATPEMTQANTTITMANVLTMFSNPTSGIWVGSAWASYTTHGLRVYNINGQISNANLSTTFLSARAAFTVDLDAYFSLWANENFKTILFKPNAGADAQNAQLIGYLSENATPSAVTTFDLTSLGLSAGDHTIKVKATATGYADSDFSNSVTYSVYEKLAAPVCSISGDTLSWAAISNAASYTLYVDSVSTQTGLTGTSFDLSTLSLAGGTYSIQLQAIGSGYYTDSELSTAVSYVTIPQLAAPQNVSVSGTEASFDEVENAESYEFFVDGTSIGEYEVPSVTLIDFTITHLGGASHFQAEDGMTWSEWCNSAYNTGGYYISGSYVFNSGGNFEVYFGNNAVSPNDTILAETYQLTGGGGD